MFKMDYYVVGEAHTFQDEDKVKEFCGTPACVLGHFGARRDLQRFMRVTVKKGRNDAGRLVPVASLVYASGKDVGLGVHFGDQSVGEYFGLDDDNDLDNLFGPSGCGSARSAKGAASFIEKFVARKLKQQAKAARKTIKPIQ
jgi:hypothetical protein